MAFPDPTFAMMPLFAQMNALEGVAVPLLPSWELDVDGLLAAKARVLYVCSPNNPTGTPAGRAAVERLLRESEAVVIVDEAYAEYANDSWATQAPLSERLLVVRTLSKAFGLAGMRIGYAVGAPDLVREVEKSRGPYKVNAIAERMGVAALTDGLPWVREKIAEVKTYRDRLFRELSGRGFTVLPSEANFLLVSVPNALEVAKRMRERGVAVRPFSNVRGFGEAVRISLGPWPVLEEALGVFQECVK